MMGGGGSMGAAAVLVLSVALTSLSGCRVEPRSDRDGAPAAGGAAGATGAAQEAARPHREIIQPEGVARLPVFSTAVRTGDLLFLSGQIGTKPGVSPPEVVEGGIGSETRQTLENIRTVLASEGLELDDLVKCTVFLADMGEYGAMNRVYLEFFPADPPARSAVAGSGLALGARVEIECIAAYPDESAAGGVGAGPSGAEPPAAGGASEGVSAGGDASAEGPVGR
ncbi:MAG: RidA family protein [Gemmatimonadota bacterium]